MVPGGLFTVFSFSNPCFFRAEIIPFGSCCSFLKGSVQIHRGEEDCTVALQSVLVDAIIVSWSEYFIGNVCLGKFIGMLFSWGFGSRLRGREAVDTHTKQLDLYNSFGCYLSPKKLEKTGSLHLNIGPRCPRRKN